MHLQCRTMAEKTIKTDSAVHDKLEGLKRKYRVETFNDVLRRELGIDSGTDLEKLTAFLNDELRDAVYQIVDDIEECGNLVRGYDQEYGREFLTFRASETDTKVADIGFRDGSFTVRYRDSKGEMNNCGKGYESSDDSVRYGTTGDLSDRHDIEDVRNSVKEKVQKSYRRWRQE